MKLGDMEVGRIGLGTNRLIKTPELNIRYEPADWAFARGVPPGEK